MEGELEPVGQEASKHGHLLVVGWADIARGFGDDVVVVGYDPGRAA
jgi:hypothetical protein